MSPSVVLKKFRPPTPPTQMSLIKQHAYTQQEMERCADEAVKEYTKALPFINYVMEFYGPESDLYPMEGLRKTDVFEAYNLYMKDCKEKKDYSWGGGDTVDRERVCGYLIQKGFSFA